MKKACVLSGIYICIALAFAACAAGSETMQGETVGSETEVSIPNQSSAQWVKLDGGDSETSIINNSTLIVRGEIVDTYIEEVESAYGGDIMPFTHFIIKIKEVYAKSLNEDQVFNSQLDQSPLTIDVRFTGDGETIVLDDAPLLEEGKEYVLFLDRDVPFEYYIPVGGRFGVAEIGNDGELRFTNDIAAMLCTHFEGSKVEDIYSCFQNVDNIENEQIYINYDNKSANDLLH